MDAINKLLSVLWKFAANKKVPTYKALFNVVFKLN